MHVEVLDFFARPRGFAQEGEARFDAWIVREAANVDLAGQTVPAVPFDQLVQDGFEGDAMEGIFGRLRHGAEATR